MTTTPFFSIIMPVYNREDILAHSIESVLHQTFQDWELLIIDDASTDQSLAIAKNYAINDERIRVLQNATNRGASHARNHGLDHAKGRFIAFLDSDDAWLPTFLKENHRIIHEAPSSHVFIQCAATRYAGDANPLTISPSNYRGRTPSHFKSVGETLGDYLFISREAALTMTLVMCGHCAKSERFREGLSRHEDHDYFIRVEHRTEYYAGINQVLAIYRDRHSSRQETKKPKDINTLMELENELQPYLSKKARIGFRANKIAPDALKQGKIALGVRLIFPGVVYRTTPLKSAILHTGLAITPQPIKNGLKKVLATLRVS